MAHFDCHYISEHEVGVILTVIIFQMLSEEYNAFFLGGPETNFVMHVSSGTGDAGDVLNHPPVRTVSSDGKPYVMSTPCAAGPFWHATDIDCSQTWWFCVVAVVLKISGKFPESFWKVSGKFPESLLFCKLSAVESFHCAAVFHWVWQW